ncbi:trypsin-like peptidase domain-containing protein [Bradyrhizobium diazoefficiens]|nr:trypsin-like peptidase domain-containing protein [Bradyrhizobium diazoefficiens]MBR0778789.1 trypsin-like peptidase domain-containing protein [Bradyrhizobium diazoefficiens]
MTTIERLKQTVAHIEATPPGAEQPRQGTAFLLSREQVLTCAHCLGDRSGYAATAKLHFSEWEDPDRQREATVQYVNWDTDVALLSFKKPAPVEPMPRACRGERGDEWEGFGYPAPVGTDGHTFDGTIANPRARHYNQDVMQLSCGLARDQLGGASGTPIAAYGHIVGMLTNQLLGYSAGPQTVMPVFDTVYALPIERLLASEEFGPAVTPVAPDWRERVVALATEFSRAAMSKRIASDGKYKPDRYVERNDVTAAFDGFMAQRDNRVFLVIAKAGAGKTTALGHLAQSRIAGPGVFFRGGVDRYAVDALRTSVADSILDPIFQATGGHLEWDDLMDVLKRRGSELVIFIDAINETEFAEIKERQKELQVLLEFIEALPARVVISCRDVFWRFFIDPRAQKDDFWWRHVFDPTYRVRCDEARQQFREKLAEAAKLAEKAGHRANVNVPTEDETKAREQAAVDQVPHRPSLTLGDFTPSELAVALDRYHLDVESDVLRTQLRHPLLLRLYAEIAVTDDVSELMTQGALLKRYLDYKLASVKNSLPSHDGRAGSQLLDRLAAEMRKQRYGRIKDDVLEDMVKDSPDLQQIRTYLLDEGIILEYFDGGLIGFQFDALFEYVLSRQISASVMRACAENHIKGLADTLATEAAQFESLVGAIEYSCTDIEATDPTCCRRILDALAATTSFGREVFLRVIAQLEEPLHQDVRKALVASLCDRNVAGKVARDAIVHAVAVRPSDSASFATTLALEADDIAIERCALAMRESVVGLVDRVAILARLLTCRSAEAAFAAVTTLREIFADDYRGHSPSRQQLNSDLLKPLSEITLNGEVSYSGLSRIVAGLLPELVGCVDGDATRRIVAAFVDRSEFVAVMHGGYLIPLCVQWLEEESAEITVLVDASHRKPALSMPLSGLIMQTLAEEPEKAKWLLAVLLRAALANGAKMNVGWMIFVQASELFPQVLDQVIAELAPAEAVEFRAQSEALGLGHIRGLNRFALTVSDLAGTAFISLLSSLGLLIWLPAGAIDIWGTSIQVATIASISLHFGVVMLFADRSLTIVLRTTPLNRWYVVGIEAIIAAALLLFRPPFIPSVVAALALFGATFGFRPTMASPQGLKGLALSFVSGCALGVVATPIVWSLGASTGLVAALVLVAAVWRCIRIWLPSFYFMLSPAFVMAVAKGAIAVGAAIAMADVWRGSLLDIVVVTLTAVLAVNLTAATFLEFKSGGIVGSPGKFVRGPICAVAALVIAGLAWFSQWLLMGIVLVSAVFLLLPAQGVSRWFTTRLGTVAEIMLFGFCAALIIWWRWDAGDGWAALFATTTLWTSLCSFATILAVLGTVAGFVLRKSLKRMGPIEEAT